MHGIIVAQPYNSSRWFSFWQADFLVVVRWPRESDYHVHVYVTIEDTDNRNLQMAEIGHTAVPRHGVTLDWLDILSITLFDSIDNLITELHQSELDLEHGPLFQLLGAKLRAQIAIVCDDLYPASPDDLEQIRAGWLLEDVGNL